MTGPIIDADVRPRTVVICEECSQKVRIPRSRTKLRVTCPSCRNSFTYQYYAAGLSSYHLKSLLIGLVGALLGFVAGEMALTSQFAHANHILAVVAMCGLFGIGLGAVLDGAEGLLRRDRARVWYALETGAPTGMVSGIIAGLIAQLVYGSIYQALVPGYSTRLWFATGGADLPFPQLFLARILGWCVMGLGMGAGYGIAAKKWKVARSGLIGGATGGAVGGLLFELAGSVTPFWYGTPARLLGFAALGTGLGLALFRTRTAAVQRRVAARAAASTGPPGTGMMVAGIGFTLVGLAIFVAGGYLYVGNTTGRHPTFPYAGCMAFNIGGFVLLMGLVALKDWFTGQS